MKVRLLRIRPEEGHAVVVDENGRTWRLPAERADADAGFAAAAWTTLLRLLPDTFEVEPRGDGEVGLAPAEPVRLRLPDGSVVEGTWRGWNRRGRANWHAIKHALHARALAAPHRAPEDWPADPRDTRAVLERIHARTRCRVHVWARRPERLACPGCNPEDAAACLATIHEDGWRPYDRATRAALRWASDPGSDTDGMVRPEPVVRGDPRYAIHDEEGTRVVVAFHRGRRPAFWSVTTFKTLSRGAATHLRRRGELASTARRLAAEEQ